jgi:hypothetical protein
MSFTGRRSSAAAGEERRRRRRWAVWFRVCVSVAHAGEDARRETRGRTDLPLA